MKCTIRDGVGSVRVGIAVFAHAVSAIPLPDLAREAGLSPATAQVSLSRLMATGLLDAAPRGVIADVLIKPGPLSRRELTELRRRFELRAAVEARQLEDVGRYASLTTCRRARLLSHFGDETAEFVAPCDGCDVCRGTSVRKPAGPRGGHPGERPGERQGGRPGERPFLLGRVLGGLCEAFGLGARVAPAAPRPNDEPPA
ncbi:MAG: RecQ family zinc-binding domain-containing protein [Actinobacteria bacterium]|nr:RecQ family zinc-binding domain-containing protein [Actinomycetota bacterium]